MKSLLFILTMLCPLVMLAQAERGAFVPETKIISYNFSPSYTLHFISPEPVIYADISNTKITGDQPEKNILRIRATQEITKADSFIVTVVTASFVVAYKLVPTSENNAVTIMIQPTDGVMLNNYNNVTQEEFYNIAINAITKKRQFNLREKDMGLDVRINNIYTISDFVILDVAVANNTNIPYTTDQLRFRIVDKKKTKAAVSQDIELTPIYSLYPKEEFARQMRNIYIFRKFTFPTAKLLKVSISEEQISGRTLALNIDYKDILKADRLQ